MKYYIRQTRHFYANTIHSGRVRYFGVHGIDTIAPLEGFKSKAEAKEAVREFSESIYYLGNGEHSRPDYMIVPESMLPDHIKQWL